MMSEELIGPHWTHLYGWPDQVLGDAVTKAKARGDSPTQYKGAVLLSLSTEQDENARPTTKAAFSPADPEECKYILRLDVFQVGAWGCVC